MKHSKTIISIVLSFLMVISGFGVLFIGSSSSVCADDSKAAGVSWSLNSSVLTISGSGAMDDYESASSSPWYSDRQTITKVIIEDGITHIGDRSLYNCNNLKYVEISDSVESIGKWVFYNLSSLEELTIPSGVNMIGDSSIRQCGALKNIYFLGDAPSIGSNVFIGCFDVLCIVTHMGSSGWDADPWASYNLKSIHILGGTSIIEKPTCTEPGSRQGTCKVCGETTIEEIPALGHDYVDGVCSRCGDIEIIDSDNGWVLYGSGLLEITEDIDWPPWNEYAVRIINVSIAEGVTSIGDYAFSNCSSLKNVTIPESVTSIRRCAFKNCSSLTSITIPESVTSIERWAFKDCSSLTSIIIPDNVTSIDGAAFTGCKHAVFYVAENSYAHSYVVDRGFKYDLTTGHKWKTKYTVDKKATYATKGSKSIHCSTCGAIKEGSSVSIPKLTVKATSITKVPAAKKGFTVKWKKISGVTGYEIQYATNSKFTKGKKTVKITKDSSTSKKITKLKAKKKYYVRVRAYKTYKGKKYYSKWSKYKTVTTKK